MTRFIASEKTWITYADPNDDIVPMDSYLGEAILKNLLKHDAERVAECNHDAEECVTIGSLYKTTITVAMNLRDFNLGPNDVIAVLSRHNSYISSLAFGCYLNGTPWCPFDIMQDDLDYLIDYLKPTIFIYDEEFIPKVKQSLERLSFKVSSELIFGNPSAENSVEKILLKPREIQDFVPKDLGKISSPEKLIACISFTSGSTGTPKAVPLTHSMFVAQINGSLIFKEVNSDYNILSPSGIRWIAQLYSMLLPIFFVVKRTYTGMDPNPKIICDVIHKWKVTTLVTANSMIHAILKHYNESPGYDFTALQFIWSGGEPPCSSSNTKFKNIIPNLIIYQSYGATECGVMIASQRDLRNLNGGEIMRGYSVKILNENGDEVGHETPGMVCIKGRCPFPGYYEREEATKTSYVNGWYITGDYGLMTKDDKLHVYCRFKDIPRCNGVLVISNLIEEHLNKHRFVDLSLVIAVPGSSPENQKIAVFVKLVETSDKNIAETELKTYLREVMDTDLLAKLSIVDNFKTNSTGKADKDILRREFNLR